MNTFSISNSSIEKDCNKIQKSIKKLSKSELIFNWVVRQELFYSLPQLRCIIE